MRVMRWNAVLVLATAMGGVLTGLAGCRQDQAALVQGDPLLAMLDESLGDRTRTMAVERTWDEVEAGQIERQTARESIKSRLLWRGGPTRVRIAAVDALLRDETPEGIADNRALFVLLLPTEGDYRVIERIGMAAAERGWTDVAPGLVRSLARDLVSIPDEERVEAAALREMFPQRTLTETVFGVFMMTEAELDQPADLARKVRTDAYEVLSRLDETGAERARLLAEIPPERAGGDQLVEDLAAAARDLAVVPLTSSELDWLSALRGGEGDERRANQRWLTAATAAVARLSEAQKQGLRLRHVEPVRWAAANQPTWLDGDFESLYEQLQMRLDAREHHRRTDGRGGDQPTWEELDRWRDRLAWGDLLTMLVVDEALGGGADASVRAALFEHLERDRKDDTTEYGGAISATGEPETWHVRLYPPRPAQRQGDDAFVASSQMFDESARALAHHHFHASKVDRSKYAGPGRADLDYAERHGRTCVVLTSVDRDTLNVDVYFRGGPIVDLGVIHRPEAAE